ncbi:MAG: low specificity L-threonine aldolase, partial [Bauldia sp.]|nr:low specificity L-threonine aldolase [Bauldia sp.]
FASDNWAGCAPEIAAALAAESARVAPAYGADALTKSVEAKFSEMFEREVAVFFVPTGTAANALSLAALARPAGIAFVHREGHANTDECGAPEYLGDLKLIGLDGPGARISRNALASALERYAPNPGRHGQPVALSLSQLTECGTAYSVPETAALAALAHEAGLGVHLDGARFANAVAGLGMSPAELSWKAGVDVMSFGGTKGGCWQAEAVIFFEPQRARDFPYLRKRAGHQVSKARFVAAQFAAYLDDGLWLRLAGHANQCAASLAAGIEAVGGRLAWPTDGNEVFAILPNTAIAALRRAGAQFYEWESDDASPGSDEGLIRLVCSFATTDVEIGRFLAALEKG